MKKILVSTVAALGLLVLSATGASAAAGGMPAAHGADGKAWGAAVSGLAKSGPGVLAGHIRMAK